MCTSCVCISEYFAVWYLGGVSQTITIGTRGSALALVQVELTKRALLAVDPTLTIEVRIITTEGDINNAPIPLDVVGKGWFTKEIESALSKGDIDLAVHSLKDVSDTIPDGLVLDAFLLREDPRDVLLTKHSESLEGLKQGAVIGTDSARRQVQMLALRPDAEMESLRGNVPTRIEKLSSQDYDAIILASAGLKRLGLEHKITRYFSPEEMTPAPGQGTLALQVREDHTELRNLLTQVNDPIIAHVTHIERSFSRTVGGGCKAPVGAYAHQDGDRCTLIGMLLDHDGILLRKTLSLPWNESRNMGEMLAHTLLRKK